MNNLGNRVGRVHLMHCGHLSKYRDSAQAIDWFKGRYDLSQPTVCHLFPASQRTH